MTLCGIIRTHSSFVAFGDAMLSRLVGRAAELPTTIDFNDSISLTSLDGYRPSGMVQKAVLIRPNVLMLWAGTADKARKLYKYVCDNLPGQHPDPEQVRLVISSFKENLDDLELIFAVLDSYELTSTFFYNTSPFDLDGASYTLLGRGIEHTFNPLVQSLSRSKIRANECAIRILRFLGASLLQQSISGFGLDRLWGGAFEVAVKQNTSFLKLDRLLIRGWRVIQNAVFRLVPTKYWFYQEYDRNGNLAVFVSDQLSPIPNARTYIVNGLDATEYLPIQGWRSPTHKLDFVFPNTFTILDPDQLAYSIRAHNSGPQTVFIGENILSITRDYSEEISLLWYFLKQSIPLNGWQAKLSYSS